MVNDGKGRSADYADETRIESFKNQIHPVSHRHRMPPGRGVHRRFHFFCSLFLDSARSASSAVNSFSPEPARGSVALGG